MARNRKTCYRHSVELDVSKCTGCTTCLKHCPTEAIRVNNGKSQINPDLCIDCGECIRVCPHNARKAMCNKWENHQDFKWKIALPAPALFGQFKDLEDADCVIQGLLDIGFDDVFEVAQAAELVSAYTRIYMKTEGIKKPVISSACPAVMRLISTRFPYLEENLIHLLPPMEIAAMMAKKKAKEEHPELDEDDIGTYFISPCPAKVSYINIGFGDYKSNVDVVISISDVYFMLLGALKRDKVPTVTSNAGMVGIGWASSGGEATAILNDKYLAADGIENVVNILEKIEDGNIPNLDFIELNACTGGCVGGMMTIENPFIAKTRLQTVRRYMPVSRNFLPGDETFIPNEYFFDAPPSYDAFTRLSDNRGEAMRMMETIQQIHKTLPGIDCGACGSPTCRAFAEDIVRKKGPTIDDCVVLQAKQNKE